LNKYIVEFLEEVCTQIKYKKIHRAISKELQSHMDELMLEYINKGMTEEEAARKTVLQMGDPIEIGQELNKTHKPKTEWSIVVLVSAMILIGGGALFAIASDKASVIGVEQFLISFLVYFILGISIALICYFMDYTKIEKYSLHIFWVVFALLYLAQKSSTKIQGIPYVTFGPFSFSPFFLLLPFFLISFSGLLNKWATGNIKEMLKLLSLAALAVLMYILYSSITGAMLLGGGFLVLITMAILDRNFKGKKIIFLFSIYGAGAVILTYLISSQPYRLARLIAFINPNADPMGAGYLSLTVEKILTGAKLWGKGEGLYLNAQNGNEAFALPMVNSEFVLTYIISAFGWFAGIVVIVIITLTIIRMFLAGQKINTSYGRYLASSIITVFALQVVTSTLMNLGLFPILAISSGGTNFITNMALVGLLLGIYRRKDLVLANNSVKG